VSNNWEQIALDHPPRKLFGRWRALHAGRAGQRHDAQPGDFACTIWPSALVIWKGPSRQSARRPKLNLATLICNRVGWKVQC